MLSFVLVIWLFIVSLCVGVAILFFVDLVE